MDKAPNSFFKQNFVKDIGKNLMPTAPLWSAIMLNDMSQHGTSKSYQEYKRKRLLSATSLADYTNCYYMKFVSIGISK